MPEVTGKPVDWDVLKEWARTLPSLAALAPSPQLITIDGVVCRVWLGRSAEGTPLRIAVHRVLMDPEHEAALLREFPILVSCEAPKRLNLGGEPCSW